MNCKPVDYSARYDERAIREARVRAKREAAMEWMGSAAVVALLGLIAWLGFAL